MNPYHSPEEDGGDTAPQKAPLVDKNGGHEEQHYTVYPIRWWILTLYCFANFLNAYEWISFAAISNYAEDFYDVPSSAVNGFSVIFMAGYFPGALLSIFSAEQFGARKSLIMGTMGNFLCAAIRYVASYIPVENNGRYIVTLFGQLFGAISQPFFMNLPSTLAVKWFPSHQREIATSIAALINPLGNAAGSLVPSLMVSQAADVRSSLLLQLGLATASAILMIIFMKERPLSPPSAAAALREEEEKQTSDDTVETVHINQSDDSITDEFISSSPGTRADSPGLATLKHVLSNCVHLLKQKNFLLLLIGFSVGLGLFNAFITLIEQIVAPCNYTSSNAGIFSAVLIVSGLVGAVIAGAILEKTKALIEVLKAMVIISFIGIATVLLLLRPDMFPYLTAAFAIMGLAILPLLPACMENAAEMTYPVHEDTSTALLIGGGQVAGIIMSFTIPQLSEKHCSTVFTPSSIFIIGMTAIALTCFLFIKKDYRRMKAEDSYTAKHADDSRLQP
eukprot:gb/GECG01002665.1/.p1 GENE.gb/GECG01002665.1/~~gb/GECG01002665.1/.p1  ORF type:complete len:506 (+),score=39.61 gb/GECG01002665.1/:1-1518(+)